MCRRILRQHFGAKAVRGMVLAMCGVLAFVLVSTRCGWCEEAAAAISVVFGQGDSDFSEFHPLVIAGYPERFPEGQTADSGDPESQQAFSPILPGPVDLWAGAAPRVTRFRFSAASLPRSPVRVRVDIVSAHSAMPPRVRWRLNGWETGEWQTVGGGAGDAVLTDASLGTEQTWDVYFPPAWFVEGENLLELESLAGSWVLLDALTIADAPDAPVDLLPTLSVAPNLIIERKDGVPMRVAALSVSSLSAAPIEIDVEVGFGDGYLGTRQIVVQTGTRSYPVHVPRPSGPLTLRLAVAYGENRKELSCEIAPTQECTVYVLMHSHFDNGYTHLQEEVIEKQCRSLDTVLDQCERTRDYPDDARFRWNAESFYVVERYLEQCGEEKRERFLELCREGRIDIMGLYGNMLTGLMSLEELAACVEPARSFCDRNGIALRSTTISDVPGYTWPLADMLPLWGINALSVGPNQTRAPYVVTEDRAFWWEGPTGGRTLVWCHPGGYGEGRGMFGLDQDFERARGCVPLVADAERRT